MLDQPRKLLPAQSDEGSKALIFPAHAQGGEEYEREGLDLTTMWQVLWARRFWLLAAGAVGLALALVVSLVQTPLYRSTAVLELNPPTIPILPEKGVNSGDLAVPTTDHEFLATQYGLLKSRALAERVVQDLNLIEGGVEEDAPKLTPQARLRKITTTLSENLDIEPVRASRLVKLSYTSGDPAEAARVINGFADAFLTSTLDRRFQATASARAFLQERLEKVRANLNESERKLVEYAKTNNIIETSSGTEGKSDADTLSGASLVAINQALAEAQQKRIAAEQRFRQSGSITEVNQSTTALRQERAKLEAEYQEKATTFQDDYPVMVSLRSRINALDRAIRNEAGGASGALRAEYQAALAEESSLRARVQQLSGNVLDQRERSIQYNILQRELDTNRALYKALLDRFNEVSLTGGASTPQASIVDRGIIPPVPFSPNIILNLALGLLLGLGLGTLVAFFHEFFTDTIKTPEDVRDKLHLPPLGVVPKKKRKEDLAEQLTDSKSAISEAYASLLTTLQFTTNEGMPRTLLVTSTQPAEGKSTTSVVLARSLAELGKTVLLVDGDMRRPSFIVEEKADIGLSRLLVGSDSVRAHILKTKSANLWLLPSGPVPPNPAQILNSHRTETIMNELMSLFDVVIVDAPPTHGFADAPLLGSVCKAVLLVVQSGKTRRRDALAVIAKLQGSGSFILGVGLTKYETTAGEYGYGYKYYENYRSIEARPEARALTSQLMGEDEK